MSDDMFYKIFNKKTNQHEFTNKFDLFSSMGQVNTRINKLIKKQQFSKWLVEGHDYSIDDFIIERYELIHKYI